MLEIPYPGFERFRVIVPSEWINESKTRWGVVSPDQVLELAGTLYMNDEFSNLEDFNFARDGFTLKRMPWYKKLSESKLNSDLWNAYYRCDYEGVWPDEQGVTSLSAFTIHISNDIFCALTFTVVKDRKAGFSSFIDSFLDKNLLFKN